MLRVNPLQIFRTFCATTVLCASASLASAETGNAIRYSLDYGDIKIHGPFGTSIDHVILSDALVDDQPDGPLTLTEARSFLGSIFALRIGDSFSELFGQGTEIDLDRFKPDVRPQSDYYYDYIALRGACLRPTNKKMVVMLDLMKAGTVNVGNPADTVFVFEDDDQQIRYEVINRENWSGATCLDDARDAARYAKAVQADEAALIEKLAPEMLEWLPDEHPFPLLAKPLEQDPGPVILGHLKRHAAYYAPTFCAGDNADNYEECAKSRSAYEPVFQHPDFDIHRLSLIRFCESSGVDFMHDKRTDTWTALYRNLPGCSKFYLCQPEYVGVEGNKLLAELPNGCIHWGEWRPLTINIDTFAADQR